MFGLSVPPPDVVWRVRRAVPPSEHGKLQAQAWGGGKLAPEGPWGARGNSCCIGGALARLRVETAVFIEERARMLIWKLAPWET